MKQLDYNTLIETDWAEQFDEEQLEVIRMGLMDGLDVSLFADPGMSRNHMLTIRNALVTDGIDVTPYYEPEVPAYQLDDYWRMLRVGHDPSPLLGKIFDSLQLRTLLAAMNLKLDIQPIANPEVTPSQMEAYMLTCLTGKSNVDWATKYDRNQLVRLRIAAASGQDISEMMRGNFSWIQMVIITKGALAGNDPTPYITPDNTPQEIGQVIRCLEVGEDPSNYETILERHPWKSSIDSRA